MTKFQCFIKRSKMGTHETFYHLTNVCIVLLKVFIKVIPVLVAGIIIFCTDVGFDEIMLMILTPVIVFIQFLWVQSIAVPFIECFIGESNA